MDRLRAESSVLQFQAYGTPAQQYKVQFLGKSLARERGKVAVRERHEFEIRLGASYPRTMPEIRWLTPIYHPNISEIGMVCLGGYGTHWAPSLNLDELCIMLWDMARFHNYDIRSPYNREAALWAANQSTFLFPLDSRPLRDLRAALGRIEPEGRPTPDPAPAPSAPSPRSDRERGPKEAAGEPEGICILDLELDLRPARPDRLRQGSDEIFFLD
jgi:hypothetical protein